MLEWTEPGKTTRVLSRDNKIKNWVTNIGFSTCVLHENLIVLCAVIFIFVYNFLREKLIFISD